MICILVLLVKVLSFGCVLCVCVDVRSMCLCSVLMESLRIPCESSAHCRSCTRWMSAYRVYICLLQTSHTPTLRVCYVVGSGLDSTSSALMSRVTSHALRMHGRAALSRDIGLPFAEGKRVIYVGYSNGPTTCKLYAYGPCSSPPPFAPNVLSDKLLPTFRSFIKIKLSGSPLRARIAYFGYIERIVICCSYRNLI